MSRIRVFQIITRMVRGGARRVVEDLLAKLPPDEFEQTLVCGSEGSTTNAVRIPEMVREIRPALDAAAALRLGALFVARRPHVVHAHTYKAGVLASVAARAVGVPAIIWTPHGHIFGREARIPGVPSSPARLAALRLITRAAQASAHRVTALSEADLKEQRALELSPPSKYVVIRNGIDVSRFDGRPASRERNGCVIGAVGRFSSEKGHGDLLEAFVRVGRALPEARLVIVGYGDLEGELRRRADLLGIAARVAFTGERDSAEMLPGFDLFVQPSLYESQGIAILEAMAAGRPVVATDVGGVRDVVRDGETGVLVRAADPEALAAAILRLAREPELAARLAARARSFVQAEFSLDRMVASYARLYKQLLGGYNSRPWRVLR